MFYKKPEEFDYFINNNKTIEHFERNIDMIVKTILNEYCFECMQ